MFKKYILFCLLMGLICMGSVVATEDINGTDADDVISIDENIDVVSDGNVDDINTNQSLKDFSKFLYKKNNVTLECDYSVNLTADSFYTSGINIIDRNLTINGDNHYFRLINKASLFKINNSNVILKDIIFLNGRDSYQSGGLIKVFNSNLTIINCSFQDCHAYKEGGVLYGKDSVVTIIGSSFNNCNSSKGSTNGGGALYVDDSTLNIYNSNFTNCHCFKTSSGGAVSAYESYTILKDCVFKNNNANSGSGAVCIEESGEVYNCLFLNNTAVNNGGALSILLKGKIFNSTFINNTAPGYGGAVNTGNCNISFCNFINNTASGNGGAVHLVDGYIDNSNFTYNRGADGSSIYCRTPMTLNITSSNFINNVASGKGTVNSVDSVFNCKFIGNYANYGGGVYLGHRDDFVLQNIIKDSIFINNEVFNWGGAVYCERVNLTVYDSIFINNTACYGGAFYVLTDLLLFDNLTFENNTGKFRGNILSGRVGNGSIVNSTNNKIDSNDITASGNTTNLILLTPDELKKQNEKNNNNSNITNNTIPDNNTPIIEPKKDTPHNTEKTTTTTIIIKSTPILTAKKATFKVKTHIKKYTVTLKVKGKPLKNIKLTLKIKGKTYTSTTNKKGKAVFKIRNLKKKGTYKATITFKGDMYYNKITKNVKIKCK